MKHFLKSFLKRSVNLLKLSYYTFWLLIAYVISSIVQVLFQVIHVFYPEINIDIVINEKKKKEHCNIENKIQQ